MFLTQSYLLRVSPELRGIFIKHTLARFILAIIYTSFLTSAIIFIIGAIY